MSDLLLTLDWQGKTYSVDLNMVTAREIRAIKQHTGLKQGEFLHSFMGNLDDLDGDALVALLWLAKKQAGDPNPQFEDDLPVMQLLEALNKVELPDEGEAPKAEAPESSST